MKINKSALRREKQDLRRKQMNHMRLHTMKTYIKRAKGQESNDEQFEKAQAHIAMCVKHGIIHRNKGARLTSRLAAHVRA